MSRIAIAKLKEQYIEYFGDVPVQKYAAQYVGRDEDTIIRWKREDVHFADAIKKKEAEWVRKKILASKAEFALERLASEIFSSKHALTANVLVAPSYTVNITDERGKYLADKYMEFMMNVTKRPFNIQEDSRRRVVPLQDRPRS